jgi:hypothetical protein
MKSAFLLSVVLLVGCSSHLTRSKAKQLLEQEAQDKRYLGYLSDELRLNIGKMSSDCFGQDLGLSHPYDQVESDDIYNALSQTGFLTIKSIGPHAYDVTLTPDGQSSVSGNPYAHKQSGRCDYWQIDVPLATFKGFTITGIQEDGSHAKADVAMTWAPTSVGIALKKQKPLRSHDLSRIPDTNQEFMTFMTESFDQYDDGWRIAQ